MIFLSTDTDPSHLHPANLHLHVLLLPSTPGTDAFHNVDTGIDCVELLCSEHWRVRWRHIHGQPDGSGHIRRFRTTANDTVRWFPGLSVANAVLHAAHVVGVINAIRPRIVSHQHIWTRKGCLTVLSWSLLWMTNKKYLTSINFKTSTFLNMSNE